MQDNISEIVLKIDQIIRQHKWFDFYVIKNEVGEIIIAGSEDLTYYHTLEIAFKDIKHFHSFYPDWHSDTKQPVFLLANNQDELRTSNNVSDEYYFFVFKIEDDAEVVVVAAKTISYNQDTVFYYDRPDLKENERIADFVNKNKMDKK